MEKQFYLTDNEGNKIDDLEKFFADNPELKDNFNSLELYENPFEHYKFLLRNGNIKTGIENFYYSKIKEIESRQNKDSFKEYLIKEKEILDFLKDEFEARINLKSGIETEIKFAFSRAKQLQKIIDKHLKDLETPKPKNYTIQNGHTATILNSFDLEGFNSLLFEKSDLMQWECLFNTQKLNIPIKLKEDVTLKDLSYFLEELSKKYSFNYAYQKCLETIGAFLFEREIVISSQLSGAKQDSKNALAPLKDKIDSLFSKEIK